MGNRVGVRLDGCLSVHSGPETSETGPIDVVDQISPRPLLLMHGEQDQAIPVAHSDRIAEAARAPMGYWRVPEAGHAALQNRWPDAYREKMLSFLARALGTPMGGAPRGPLVNPEPSGELQELQQQLFEATKGADAAP